MIILILSSNNPTTLSWDENNTGDYKYEFRDYSEIDKFFKEFKKRLAGKKIIEKK